MRTLKTIVLGMDWSPAAMDAWQAGTSLARTFGAELVLVHALPPDLGGPRELEEVRLRAEELLHDMQGGPAGEGLRVRTIVEAGPSTDVLLNAAREQRADLVVIGAGQKTALDAVLLGRTAERVVAESPAPVWVVRPGRPNADPKKILCATDDGPAAREALGEAVFLCRTFVASLTALTVLPDPEAPLLPGLPPRTANAPQRADAYAKGELDLKAWLARLDHHGVPVELRVRLGKPAPAIVDAAQELRCDLLVIGTAGRTGLARVWNGSTAERVVRAVPTSLLVVKAPRTI